MAESLNQQISDRFVERQILAGRVETQERQEVWALLALLEADLLAVLKIADPFVVEQLARRRRAVERMVTEDMAPLITARYAQIAAQVDAVLVRLAQAEARATQEMVNDATGEETVEERPPPGLVHLAVTQTLFPSPATATDLSTTGSDWWTRQGESLTQRLHDQLMLTAALEGTLAEAVRRVEGTRANGYQDGLMAKARDDAARLLRTQTTNALGEAHAAVGRVNPGQGLVLEHASILDSRVSHICLSRHGLRYTATPEHEPIGHSIPYLTGVPYHVNALAEDTAILTSDGWITIQNVHVGMRVMTHGGRWCRVTETMSEYVKSRIIRRLHTNTGRILWATDEHPILTTDRGWLRVDQLQVGDQCLEYTPETIQAQSFRMFSVKRHCMAYDSPSLSYQCICTDCIMRDAFSTAMGRTIDFEPNTIHRPCKIEDIDTNGILESQARDALWGQQGEEILLSFCRVFSQISCPPCTHTCHGGIVCRGIMFSHAVTMALEKRRCFLAHTIGPMVRSSWSSCFPSLCGIVGLEAVHSPSNSNVVSFAPEIQCGFGETLLSFNSSQGFSLCPMFDTNQFTQGFPVFQINHAGLPSVFKTSTIISIDVKNYDGFVYNLAVDDDESYVAEGIIVHNCRSSMLLVTMNGGPIRQEDASQWLRRRDAAYQDEVLGPARGRMFRAGALTPRGLLDAATGRPLTLEDLGA